MTGKPFKTCAIGVAMVWLSLYDPVDANGIAFDTRILTGDSAPGLPAGVVFQSLRDLVLNDSGQLAFTGVLIGPNVTGANNTGVWSEGSGTLQLIARASEPAPGTATDQVFFSVGKPMLNSIGQTAFMGQLSGPGVDRFNNTGIWIRSSSSLGLVAREGSAAPGTPPGVTFDFDNFDVAAFNNAGQVGLWSEYSGIDMAGVNNTGIWLGGAGSLGLVTRAGDPAPGPIQGDIFVDVRSPAFNNTGNMVFHGAIDRTGVFGLNASGIWSDSSGSLTMIALDGMKAPGTANDTVFRGFDPPLINDAGDLAFLGGLTGPSVQSENDTGIWVEREDSVELIVRSGDPAPGTNPGAVFSTFNYLALGETGKIAFLGSLSGNDVDTSNSRGIWMESSGSLKLVARSGDPAPGIRPGVVYRIVNAPVYNGLGQIAYMGELSGADVDFTNQIGIWATDHNGKPTLVVRAGDMFDVNDDPLIEDLRKIKSVHLTLNTTGDVKVEGTFNDTGQLAFFLKFTDGSEGIFVATIPEPGTVVVLMASSGLMLRRRCG